MSGYLGIINNQITRSILDYDAMKRLSEEAGDAEVLFKKFRSKRKYEKNRQPLKSIENLETSLQGLRQYMNSLLELRKDTLNNGAYKLAVLRD